VQPNQGASLTEVPLLRATVTFGAPMVVAMALGALFNLVDLWIVGKMAHPEISIAAVTIPSLVNSIPMIIFNGIVNAIIALVARFHGLGNLKRANVAAGQGFLLTLVLSVIFGLPPWLYASQICELLGAKGAVVPGATAYLQIMSVGTFTMFLLMMVTGAMRAVGNSIVPMLLLGGANLLNVGLDFLLIFGKWGFPQLGVAGAAWATVIARGIFAAGGLMLMYRGFLGLKLRRWYVRWRTLWAVLRIGIPSCGQWLVRMVSYLYILYFVAQAAPLAGRGITEAQAAFGVGLRLDTLALFSGFGWGAAAATLVGQNLGRGRADRARRASWIALGLNVAMMLVFAAIYVLFADTLLGIMGFDLVGADGGGQVMEIGRTYLYVTSSGFVFLAVAVVLSQALAGAGATKFPLLIEVVAYGAIGYPFLRWVASRADVWGLRGLWLAAVALHLAVAIAYLVWFKFGPWAKKEIT
jgi:putative MATE family efflux protein